MADISKTVEIIFQGVDRVGDGITAAAGQLDGFGAAVEAAARPLANLADWVIKADTALAAMASGALILAVNEAQKFQAAFGEIGTIAGTSADNLDAFRQSILTYAQDSSKSLNEITGAIYTAISAGVSYKDSLELIKTAEQLSIAGRADLKETTLGLISVMNAYGAGMADAAKYSDILFQTVKVGQTTLPELNQSLANVTGIAASAQVPFETLAAAIAALTASGLPTSQAITGIKAALENIIKPSSEAQKVAAALGIEFNAAALQSKGFDGILREIQAATGGNVETMGKLFGSVEGLNAILTLAADRSGKFREALAAMAQAAGSTEAAYQMMAQNLDLATQRLKNNVTVVLEEIGSRLLPTVTGDVNALSDLFKSLTFAVNAGAFDPLFELLAQAGAKIEAVIREIAANLPAALEQVDFSGLIDSLKSLGDSISDIFEGIDISTPEGLAEAIQFVVDATTALINTTKGMVDAFRPMIDTIIEGIRYYSQMGAESQEMGGRILGTAKMVVDAGIEIAAAIIAISEAGANLKGVFEIIDGVLKTTWNTLQMTVEAGALIILEAVRALVEGLNTVTFGGFEGTLGRLDAAINNIKESFARDWGEATDGVLLVAKGFEDLGDNADAASGQVERTKEAIEGIPEKKATSLELDYEKTLEDVKKVAKGLEEIPDATVSIEAQPNEVSFAEAKRKIDDYIHEDKGVIVITQPDQTKLTETQKVINDTIPAEKKLQIEAEIDKERIRAQTEEVKAYFDFKAKVDIAEIEAAAKIMEAAFSSVNTTIEATSKTLDNLFELWLKADVFEQGQLAYWIEQQLELQRRAVDMQERLVNSQIKYFEAKAGALDRGDAMITIQGDGLEPELEAFMFKILDRIQVRVAEEHAEFLLGLT